MKPLALLFLLSLLASLPGLACSGDSGEPVEPTATLVAETSSTRAEAPPDCEYEARPTGSSRETFTSAGLERSFELYVPASYSGRDALPLVLNFHGQGRTGKHEETYSQMPEEAEASGFITAAPDALGGEWSLDGARPDGGNDYEFVRALIAHLSETTCIDMKRIYATGLSNGGGFVSALACSLNDVLAAVAPVAGEPYFAAHCAGKLPVPIIFFHGTADQQVPFEHSEARLGNVEGAHADLQDWARHNGCIEPLVTERVAEDVVRESYAACSNGAETVFYVIEGGGHTWPGAPPDTGGIGPTTMSIDATELIWAFFAAHPRP